MSDEDMQKALVRLSLFAISEEIDEIRDELQENIVEMALFWGTNEGEFIARGRIKELVRKELYLIDFPDSVLGDIISRMVSKGVLDKDENGRYHLTNFRRTEIQRLLGKRREKMAGINQEFVLRLEQEYGRELSREQKEMGLEKFYSYLATLAMEKSDLTARIVTKKNIELLPMELNIHILFGTLAKIGDMELRNAEMRAIKSMFRNASDDFCSFLFLLTQNLVCIKILNIDPQCQSLEREAFRKKMLLLDTNVIIALLCPTHWMHKVAEQLVTLSRSLGTVCIATKATCKEYLKELEEANKVYKKWQAPFRFLESADNEFLVSFWSEKQAENQSWETYYGRMKSVETTLEQRGIEFFDDIKWARTITHVYAIKHFKEVVDEVDLCCQELRTRHKSKTVCEHDAFHLLLVRELREKDKSPLIGPNYWFATGDQTLLCVDRKINMLKAYSNNTPSSMLCDLWLEMISPFLPSIVREKEAYEAFSMLVKRQFAVIPFAIDTDAFLKIQGKWMEYDWLESQDIVEIQNKEWTKKYVSKVKKAQSADKVRSLTEVFAKKLDQELRVMKDGKVQKLSEDVKVLSEQQAELRRLLEARQQKIITQQKIIQGKEEKLTERQAFIEGQTQEMKTEADFKRKMRIVAAIAGLFLIFCPSIFVFVGLLPINVTTVLYCAGSLVIGAILLYFAIAYEKAKVSLEAKLDLSGRGSV